MKTRLLYLLFLFSSFMHAQIYVDINATGSNDGTSWTNAYTNLQTALDAAGTNRQVWVAKGVYTPPGSRNWSTFYARKGGKVYGGFAGNETSLADRDMSLIYTTNATRLSGDFAKNDNSNIHTTEPTRYENAWHVLSMKDYNGGDFGFFDGFIIEGGNAIGNAKTLCGYANTRNYDRRKGAAIKLYIERASQTVKFKLKNCMIRNNSAISYAVYHKYLYCRKERSTNAYMTFENCIIKNNYSKNDSNMQFYGSQGYDGRSFVSIINTLITNNRTSSSSKPSVFELHSNGGDRSHLTPASHLKMVNSTIVNNYSPSKKAFSINLTRASSYPVYVYNSVVYNNGDNAPIEIAGNGASATFSNNIIQGGQYSQQDVDPMLRGDFKLLSGSPAIDAGDNSKLDASYTTDLANSNRIQNSTIDIGAYEGTFNQVYYSLTTNATDGTIANSPTATNPSGYPLNENVTLTATPDQGYQFDGWSGDATGNTNPLQVTMDSDKNITANFSVIPAPVPSFVSLPTDVSAAFTATINFDKAVSGFAISDITVSGATLSNFTTVNSTKYTVLVTPSSICNTSITLEVPANVATEAGGGNLDNVSSGAQTVTTTDNLDPTVITQNITVQLDANGSVTITPQQIDNGSSDNCSIASMSLNTTSFGCSDIGDNTVTLTVVDGEGNTATRTAVVSVEDRINPVVSTQDITINLDANNQATITENDIHNTSSDNCSIISKSINKSSFTCDDLGDNTVTLTVQDAFGNRATATAVVTVNPNPSAQLEAIAQNITVQLDANGQATITPQQIDNGSESGCNSNPALSLDKTTFDCSNIGANTVTLTATDASGSQTATATVTVEDAILPVVQTQNITVQLDANGNATITPQQIDNGSSDNCSIASMSLDVTSFNCSNIGTNTVTLTVVDAGGNSVDKMAVVTVEDAIDPVIVVQNITIQLDVNSQATISASQIDNGSSDNCSIASMSLDKSSFTCANLGANNVVLTVEDASGNSVTATAVVTVNENPNAQLTAVTQNITVQLDANGQATITPQQVDNGSGSGCNSNPTLSLDVTSFDCSNIGANTVTLTATDNSGSQTATATVTVEDTVLPVVQTRDITVQLDASGSATITPQQIDNGSSDNCSIASMSLDTTSFDCSNTGANTVTLSVVDGEGNTATKTATVTVEDSINPIVATINITVNLDSNNQATITPSQIDNGSSDNCSITSMSLDKSTFTCADLGDNTVKLTVEDASGNQQMFTAVVTVNPNPNAQLEAVTQNITVQLDANGQATITPQQVNNGSGSGCNNNPTLSLDVTSFDCSNIGTNTVTLTATDGGNTATATATVTVEDTIEPTVNTKNITVTLNNGQASITPADVDNNSTDNCSIASSSLDVTSFDCSNIGQNTVTLTVVDGEGNTATGTAIVTVVETEAPIVVTQNITVSLDATGAATITPQQIDNGSSDGCSGVKSITLDKTSFQCPMLGDQTVTLTVTDNNDNVATKTAIVTFTAPDEDNDGISDACDSKELIFTKGFSPNGDGVNDTWSIENIDNYPKNKLEIYNRWGQKVYEATNYQNNFDGTAANSSAKLPAGSYIYIIRLNEAGLSPIQGSLYINY